MNDLKGRYQSFEKKKPAASKYRHIPEDGSFRGHYHLKLSSFMTIVIKCLEVQVE
jgi:hypothetical protein